MKLGSALYRGTSYVFIQGDDGLILPALDDAHQQAFWYSMLDFIEAGDEALHAAQAIYQNSTPHMRLDPSIVEYQAPIVRPRRNVMCLGLNYLEHAEETAELVGRTAKAPEYPIVFTKATNCVIAHGANVPFDEDSCSQLDWEAELGVIIGKGGKKITEDNALTHIFGYTVINDLSARDLQHNHKQFFMGKSFDGSCPIGPYIVTADEIADPQALDIMCRVNGETKQSSNTQHMIFDIRSIIAILSKSMTLEAGDIIATGTPSGVGFARNPQEFLRPGDTVECEVSGVGILSNHIA